VPSSPAGRVTTRGLLPQKRQASSSPGSSPIDDDGDYTPTKPSRQTHRRALRRNQKKSKQLPNGDYPPKVSHSISSTTSQELMGAPQRPPPVPIAPRPSMTFEERNRIVSMEEGSYGANGPRLASGGPMCYASSSHTRNSSKEDVRSGRNAAPGQPSSIASEPMSSLEQPVSRAGSNLNPQAASFVPGPAPYAHPQSVNSRSVEVAPPGRSYARPRGRSTQSPQFGAIPERLKTQSARSTQSPQQFSNTPGKPMLPAIPANLVYPLPAKPPKSLNPFTIQPIVVVSLDQWNAAQQSIDDDPFVDPALVAHDRAHPPPTPLQNVLHTIAPKLPDRPEYKAWNSVTQGLPRPPPAPEPEQGPITYNTWCNLKGAEYENHLHRLVTSLGPEPTRVHPMVDDTGAPVCIWCPPGTRTSMFRMPEGRGPSRAKFSCPKCWIFHSWADMVGCVDSVELEGYAERLKCDCPTRLPARPRLHVAGPGHEHPGALIWECALMKCDFERYAVSVKKPGVLMYLKHNEARWRGLGIISAGGAYDKHTVARWRGLGIIS
jgi:hypothetical protein